MCIPLFLKLLRLHILNDMLNKSQIISSFDTINMVNYNGIYKSYQCLLTTSRFLLFEINPYRKRFAMLEVLCLLIFY